jgi:chaperonin GroEL
LLNRTRGQVREQGADARSRLPDTSTAGDGTTTTKAGAGDRAQGGKAVAAGMNPMDLKRGIDIAVLAVVMISRSAAGRFLVRSRSGRHHLANGDTAIGKMIAQACRRSAMKA